MMLPEEVAAIILAETVHSRTSLRDVATRFFSRHPEMDYMKPIVRVLTLGVARNYMLLDRILVSYGYGPPSHSTKWMLARVLVYEAISGKLKPTRARKLAPRAGVESEKILELRGADPREFVKGLNGLDKLSVLYSFPRWIIEELVSAGIENVSQLLQALNKDPQRWIRFAPSIRFEYLALRLREHGIVIEPDKHLYDVAKIVKGASKAAKTKEYQQGLYVLQDKASALVNHVASPQDKIGIDPTAGAAIKASHMAWLGARYVIAGDLKPQRIREARHTLRRLHIGHIVDLVVGDARSIYVRTFGAAIVDPPCTDIGRLQYEPEVKMWLTRGDLKFYSRLQEKMLRSVLEAAPRGAVIVYSVCTLTYSETIRVVRRVIETVQEAELVEPEPVIGEKPKKLPRTQRLLPHIHKTQGFFIAKFMKL
jgi:16S rRNA (cytosine967-C5)-methyltransferase